MNLCFYHSRLFLINSSRFIVKSNCTTLATLRTLLQPRKYTSLTGQMESRLGNANKPEYMPIEDVEKLERYRPGGYHPVTIGEQLGGRYSIVHKLGFGGYSTIWLARDQK